MHTITAATHDDTFGIVSVTKRTSRPYTYACVRVSDTGDVSASFHMTLAAADKAAGRPAPGITRHVVPVQERGIVPNRNITVANRNTPQKEESK